MTSSKGTPGSRGVDYEFDAPRVKELFDDNFSPGILFSYELTQTELAL